MIWDELWTWLSLSRRSRWSAIWSNYKLWRLFHFCSLPLSPPLKVWCVLIYARRCLGEVRLDTALPNTTVWRSQRKTGSIFWIMLLCSPFWKYVFALFRVSDTDLFKVRSFSFFFFFCYFNAEQENYNGLAFWPLLCPYHYWHLLIERRVKEFAFFALFTSWKYFICTLLGAKIR